MVSVNIACADINVIFIYVFMKKQRRLKLNGWGKDTNRQIHDKKQQKNEDDVGSIKAYSNKTTKIDK